MVHLKLPPYKTIGHHSNVLRKTKVIATIGPACESVEVLKKMIVAGMNVARLNMSHGDLNIHTKTLNLIRQLSKEMATNVAIMLDTRGREIRTKKLIHSKVDLEYKKTFTLYGDHPKDGDENGVSITFNNLYQHVKKGDQIFLDDGQILLIVKYIKKPNIICQVECGGVLRNSKGVNLPDNKHAFSAIPLNNALEMKFASNNKVDYIAASFIRNVMDIISLRNELMQYGLRIPIIAKIENREGVKNLDSIINISDGIMVARGDLGIELDIGEGPTIQKKIIRATVSHGKPVITATQMLDSMERNPRPTRAEVSDVANAIFDGTSAIMLSGETASGTRPVESVETMVSLSRKAESSLREYGYLQQIKANPSNEVTEAVAQASITMAHHIHAAAIIALTETGFTSRLISKYRPHCPIFAVTSSMEVVTRLAMNWGVLPMHYEGNGSDEDKIEFATHKAIELGYVKKHDLLIMTAGSFRQAGSTDFIRVLTVS